MSAPVLRVGDVVEFRMRSAGDIHPWQPGCLYANPDSAWPLVRDSKGGILRVAAADIRISAANVLREVAEALKAAGLAVANHPDRLDVEIVGLHQDCPACSAEDVLSYLPERLWERISVTRVAPGRFVVEEKL